MQKHIPQGQGSAQSFIAILGENIPQIQVNALKNLNRMVDFAWAEMADSLPKFEAFMDDPKRMLATYDVHLPDAVEIEVESEPGKRPRIVVYQISLGGRKRRLLYLQLVMMAGR